MTSTPNDGRQWQDEVLARLHAPGPVPQQPAATGRMQSGPATYRAPPHLSALQERPRRLQRRLSARPGASRPRRWWAHLRAVVGADDEPARYAAALAGVRRAVATGRRVVVVSAHGGAGATTVALCLSQALHAHRQDGVVLLDAGPARGGLLSRLAHAPAMSVDAARARPAGAAGDVARMRSLQPQPAVLTPAGSGPEVGRVVADGLRRALAFTVIDAGLEAGCYLEAASCAVVVAENTLRGLLSAQACLHQMGAAGMPSAPVVVVVADRVADPGVPVGQLVQGLRGTGAWTVLVLPRDRHLGGAAQVHPELLALATSIAVLELAAAVVGASLET